MLIRAWRSLRARFRRGQRKGLRLTVHRSPSFPSFWRPIEMPDGHPAVEVEVHLEAVNLAPDTLWLVGAELVDAPVREAAIGVREPGTGRFAPDNPLVPGRATTVLLRFVVEGGPSTEGGPFEATVVVTDQRRGRHTVRIVLH
jgi:hypothetical protein